MGKSNLFMQAIKLQQNVIYDSGSPRTAKMPMVNTKITVTIKSHVNSFYDSETDFNILYHLSLFDTL